MSKHEIICPFCRGHLLDVIWRTDHTVLLYVVRCRGCGAMGPAGRSKAAAVRAWRRGRYDQTGRLP